MLILCVFNVFSGNEMIVYGKYAASVFCACCCQKEIGASSDFTAEKLYAITI